MTVANDSPNLVLEGSTGSMLVAWVMGMVLVFALQLTVAALGIAIASTTTSFRTGSTDSDSATSNLPTAAIIGGAAVGTLLGVDTTLFAACFAVVNLLPSASVESGAVLGLGIWGSYLLLCTWTSYSAANTVLSAASKLVFGGLGRLIRTTSHSFRDSDTPSSPTGSNTTEDSDRMSQMLERLSGLHQTIQEISSGTDFAAMGAVTSEFWDWLSNRREKGLPPSQFYNLDTATIRKEIQSFLDDKSLEIADEDIPAVKTMLEDITLGLQERGGAGDFNPPTKSANLVQAVRTEDADTLLDTVDELSTEQRSHGSSVWDSLASIDLESVMESLFSRADFSDWDIESVWQTVQSLAPMVGDREQSSGPPPSPNIIGLDLKHYLSDLYPWQLNPDYLTKTMPDVLRDPDADPVRVLELLNDIDTAYMVGILEAHPANLSPDLVRALSSHLNSICTTTLGTVRADSTRLAVAELDRVFVEQVQLRSDAETSPDTFETLANTLLDDVESTYISPLVESVLQTISERAPTQWIETLTADITIVLNERNRDVLMKLANQVVTEADRRLFALRDRQKRIEAATRTIERKLQSYLRYTSLEKLDSPRIQEKLDRLMAEVSLAEDERGDLTIDLVALDAILDRRKSLQPSHHQQILSSVDRYFERFQPASHLRNGSESELAGISSELRDIIVTHLERSEFDREQLQQDLLQWCQSPASGQQILVRRLGQIDWMSLISDVASRVSIDIPSIRTAVGTAYSVFQHHLKAPRRWVKRAKPHVPDLVTHLRTYLQFTPKSDFNPQMIGQNLMLLYERGGSSMPEEFSTQLGSDSFSLSSIRALLEQRADLTASEAGQIAQHVSETIVELKERSKTVLQHGRTYSHGITDRVQSFVSSNGQPSSSDQSSSSHSSSANHLSKLEVALQTVTSRTQEGLSAVTNELNQLTSTESLEQVYHQLQALADTAQSLASQVPQKISSDLADSVQSHLNDAGQRIAENIGQLQQQVEARIDAAKELAIEQAETARKAVAVAAWWLFAIATTSAIAAASAGVLAVTGLPVPFTNITL